jgi:hypothetical protein
VSPLGLHRFEQRLATITSVLTSTGRVQIEDAGRRTRRRSVRFAVEAPGGPLPALARFKYEEWYERDRTGLRLVRYHYDYRDTVRGGRLAYHWHRLARRDPVHHAHCETSSASPAHAHYRFYEMDLLEAHADFVRLYAAEEPIDCSGLRPLPAR